MKGAGGGECEIVARDAAAVCVDELGDVFRDVRGGTVGVCAA